MYVLSEISTFTIILVFCNLWVKELYGDNIHPRELTKKKNQIVHLKIKIYSHYYLLLTSKPNWALPPPHV